MFQNAVCHNNRRLGVRLSEVRLISLPLDADPDAAPQPSTKKPKPAEPQNSSRQPQKPGSRPKSPAAKELSPSPENARSPRGRPPRNSRQSPPGSPRDASARGYFSCPVTKPVHDTPNASLRCEGRTSASAKKQNRES